MLSETVVSTFLVASITGGGLVLAIYALITPMSERIFKERARKLEGLLEDFEKEKVKITADSSDKDFKRFNNLRDKIKQMSIFPRYLGVGIIITFFLFMMSGILDASWLSQTAYQVSENDVLISGTFLLAIWSFLLLGGYAIAEIFNTMRKEFEDIKKKQKEAKEWKKELTGSLGFSESVETIVTKGKQSS